VDQNVGSLSKVSDFRIPRKTLCVSKCAVLYRFEFKYSKLWAKYYAKNSPMTFMYEFDPYSMEIYRMSENELPTSRLSKVIV